MPDITLYYSYTYIRDEAWLKDAVSYLPKARDATRTAVATQDGGDKLVLLIFEFKSCCR